MKTSKKNTSKKSSATRSAVKNGFKEGHSVTYDGKKFTVKKAYVYHDKPFCIITNKTHSRVQVSANSLK